MYIPFALNVLSRILFHASSARCVSVKQEGKPLRIRVQRCYKLDILASRELFRKKRTQGTQPFRVEFSTGSVLPNCIYILIFGEFFTVSVRRKLHSMMVAVKRVRPWPIQRPEIFLFKTRCRACARARAYVCMMCARDKRSVHCNRLMSVYRKLSVSMLYSNCIEAGMLRMHNKNFSISHRTATAKYFVSCNTPFRIALSLNANGLHNPVLSCAID